MEARVRTRSQIGKSSCRKGKDFERQIVHAISCLWPEARRNISQSRGARREGGDILGTPYFIECKHKRALSLDDALAQAEADSGGAPAIVIARRHGERHSVVYGRCAALGLLDVRLVVTESALVVSQMPVAVRLDRWVRWQLERAAAEAA